MKTSPVIGFGVAAAGFATALGAYFYSTRTPSVAPQAGLGAPMYAALTARKTIGCAPEAAANQMATAVRALRACGYQVPEINVIAPGGYNFTRV